MALLLLLLLLLRRAGCREREGGREREGEMAEEGTPPLAVLDDKKWKVENVEGTMDEPKVRKPHMYASALPPRMQAPPCVGCA